MLYLRKGNTTASHVRTCDTVSAGAFFPQVNLEMPQQERRQHRREHVVVPACLLPHCIVAHPACRFAFCKALLHGPAQTTEPDAGTPGGARWGITDRVGIRRLGPHRPLDHQPHGALRQAVLTQRDPLAGTRLRARPLGPF
jgi:hypothetical protein